MNYYRVAVNTPFNNSFLSYSSSNSFEVGDIVKVPLGKRTELGLILESLEREENIDYKEIIETVPESLKSEDYFIQLIKTVSQYYYYPMGRLYFESLPKLLKRPRGKIEYIHGEFSRKITPNPLQQEIIDSIEVKMKADPIQQFLIHGVTGSGKTLIYTELMSKVIKEGKSILFLLPEINLTPQFVEDLSKQINGKILTYNSSLNDSQKFHVWNEVHNLTEPLVIIGVRSSVFLPIKNLGLIIVDEEHDHSFKQEDRCPYHARDVAFFKAKISKCAVLLGSATPSVESYFRFKNLMPDHYYRLDKRANLRPMPSIVLVDKKNEKKESVISEKSIEMLEQANKNNRQSIIYINRLGYAQFLTCQKCGHRFECPNCSMSLRVFKRKNILRCSCCNYETRKPDQCPECQNLKLEPIGIGTERIVESLSSSHKELRVSRFDREELKSFEEIKQTLKDFADSKIDVLVGTQMITKGHNFEKVDNVIILGIDNQLNFPDFRSGERVFQQVIQVAGRSGRFENEGYVVVETMNSENEIFDYIKNYKVDEFYDFELNLRKVTQFPPYSFLAMLSISGTKLDKVVEQSHSMISELQKYNRGTCEVFGPKPAIIEKRVNKFTWNIILRSSNRNSLRLVLDNWYKNNKLQSGISLKIDIDPLSIN